MRLIDAEPIIKNLSAMKTQLGYDAIDIDGMIKALREAEKVTASPPLNNPLTLEELREMDGEPVWVECPTNQKCSCWGYHDEDGFNGYCAYFDDDEYGKVWLAYRRKPEEG